MTWWSNLHAELHSNGQASSAVLPDLHGTHDLESTCENSSHLWPENLKVQKYLCMTWWLNLLAALHSSSGSSSAVLPNLYGAHELDSRWENSSHLTPESPEMLVYDMMVEFACSIPLQRRSFVSHSSRPTWGPWSFAAFTGHCWRSIHTGQSRRRGRTPCTLCWKPSSERQRWGRETQSTRLSEIARCMFFNGRGMVWQREVWFDTGQFEIPTSANEVRSMVWQC